MSTYTKMSRGGFVRGDYVRIPRISNIYIYLYVSDQSVFIGSEKVCKVETVCYTTPTFCSVSYFLIVITQI